MKKIDKLIKDARSKAHGDKFLSVAFIDKTEEGSYSVIADLWNGKTAGSGGTSERITLTAKTEQDAYKLIEELENQYGKGKGGPVIIVDDYEHAQ